MPSGRARKTRMRTVSFFILIRAEHLAKRIISLSTFASDAGFLPVLDERKHPWHRHKDEFRRIKRCAVHNQTMQVEFTFQIRLAENAHIAPAYTQCQKILLRPLANKLPVVIFPHHRTWAIRRFKLLLVDVCKKLEAKAKRGFGRFGFLKARSMTYIRNEAKRHKRSRRTRRSRLCRKCLCGPRCHFRDVFGHARHTKLHVMTVQRFANKHKVKWSKAKQG